MSTIVFSALQVVWADPSKPNTFIPLCDKSLIDGEDGTMLKKPKEAKEAILLKNCLLTSTPIYENRLWVGMNNVAGVNNNIILKNVNNLLISERRNMSVVRSIIRLDYRVRNPPTHLKTVEQHDTLILSSWM